MVSEKKKVNNLPRNGFYSIINSFKYFISSENVLKITQCTQKVHQVHFYTYVLDALT